MTARCLIAGAALAAAVLGARGPAFAQCADATLLQEAMSAYAALLADPAGPSALTNARLLLDFSPEAFARQARPLQVAIEAARTLAQQAEGRIPAKPVTETESMRHLWHIGRIASAIQSDHCTPLSGHDMAENARSGTADHRMALGGARFGFDTLASSRTPHWPLLLALVAPLSIGGLVMTARRIRPRFRRQHERYPCHLRLPVAREGSQEWSTLLAVEISLGGLKLGLGEPLEPGTGVEAFLMGERVQATVTWSNPHYAGLKFRRVLEPDTLASLLSFRHTGDLTPIENGASEETPHSIQISEGSKLRKLL